MTRSSFLRFVPGRFLFAACLSLAAVPLAQAQVTLVAYDFNDQTSEVATLTASIVAPQLTASLFSISDAAFTSLNFTTATPPDTPAIADSGGWNTSAPSKYFSFTLAPQADSGIDVTQLTFDYRQTTAGALTYQIDFGAATDVFSGTFTRDSAWHSLALDLTLPTLVAPTEVKIYGYGGGTGSFGIDRVTLKGDLVAPRAASVPEAGHTALFTATGLFLCALLRRRAAFRARD